MISNWLKKFFRGYNSLIYVFIGLCLLVFLALIYKSFYKKPNYLYVKVKVGQGLWWAATQKPDFWFVKSIKPKEKEVDFAGQSQAEILDFRYYPILSENSYPRYDIYLDIKLQASYDKKNDQYFFKRNVVSVGSPIEFEFPSVNLTGTIIEMSNKEIKTKYVEKTVYLYNYGAYKKDFTYLFDSIKLGDKYFDGKKEVLDIVDKQLIESVRLPSDIYGRLYEQLTDVVQHILVKAKVKFIEKNGQLFYGEERTLRVGDQAPFITDGYNFEAFSVVKIE